MGAWQASLEFEMDLAHRVEKEKGHSISEADQAAEKVLNIFSSRHVLDTIGRAGPGLSSPTIKAPLLPWARNSKSSSTQLHFMGPHSLPGGLFTGGIIQQSLVLKDPKEEGPFSSLESRTGKATWTGPVSIGIRKPKGIVIGSKRKDDSLQPPACAENELVGFDSQPLAYWLPVDKKLRPLKDSKKKKTGVCREKKGKGELNAGAHLSCHYYIGRNRRITFNRSCPIINGVRDHPSNIWRYLNKNF
ncbi:hypothetical protein CJ030_MR3G008362 [Morella rubra]|uniref:Uncharacterized protein n=1 Tax=Morella rubra TaxID=262757 RepID=A0A6A1W1U3_9ROSI|nr:hypothetical protein CJ030_MR3G008373 [Morella rubra]KAB1219171.1 hypothetical protein CJ030_MR3G008362 [Morella rubra]